MKRAIALVCLAAAFPAVSGAPPASPSGPFLCIVEQAVGFAFDKETKSWHSANFKPGRKLIVKRYVYDKAVPAQILAGAAAWGVWDFGNDNLAAYNCQSDFGEKGTLDCEGLTGRRFNFALHNKRFITYFLAGIIESGSPVYQYGDGKPMPEGSDNPLIEIGSCTTL